MSKLSFFELIIILLYSINIIAIQSKDISEKTEFIFPEDINFTEYKEICRENVFYDHQKCFSFSQKYEEKIINNLLSTNFISKENQLSEKNKEKISYILYNIGNICYHGYIAKEPDLDKGLAYFIVSSYFGSPQSKYKLSIIISNSLFEQIYISQKFQKLMNEFELLKRVSQTEFYIKNFGVLMKEYYSEESNTTKRLQEFKNNLAISFLYSATLQNYPPAKKLLASKLNKGYDISYSCSGAIKYYLELAKDTLKEVSELNTKLFFNYEKLDKYEYVGSKFDEDNTKDEKQIIDLYWSQISKKRDKNNIKIIKELAKIYYYGSSVVKQDYETSLYLFNRAAQLNDTESLFFIGEHYLNGWGTEKDYKKAFEYFNKSISYNNTDNAKSWNSLGYLYYYGLGVEKNVKKAFDYFNVGISYKDSSATYDAAYLFVVENLRFGETIQFLFLYPEEIDPALRSQHDIAIGILAKGVALLLGEQAVPSEREEIASSGIHATYPRGSAHPQEST